MKRNQVCVTCPHDMVGRKFKEFFATLQKNGENCLKSEINKLSASEPYTYEVMNYLEDVTNEVRKVICINFGIPTQLSVSFYR